MEETLDRLIEKIHAAPVDTLPVDNIYMEEVFEPGLYAEMLTRLPGDDFYEFIEHRDAVLEDGTITRKLLDLTNETIEFLNPSDREFWRRMKAVLTSDKLLGALIRKFEVNVGKRFHDKLPSMVAVPVFYRDYPGYHLRIHPDTPHKIVTLQFYLPADNAQIHLGTSFHIKDGKHFREHKTNLFKPNSAYAFARTDDSWHSVRHIGSEESIRNTLALTIYVKGQQYKSKRPYR